MRIVPRDFAHARASKVAYWRSLTAADRIPPVDELGAICWSFTPDWPTEAQRLPTSSPASACRRPGTCRELPQAFSRETHCSSLCRDFGGLERAFCNGSVMHPVRYGQRRLRWLPRRGREPHKTNARDKLHDARSRLARRCSTPGAVASVQWSKTQARSPARRGLRAITQRAPSDHRAIACLESQWRRAHTASAAR